MKLVELYKAHIEKTGLYDETEKNFYDRYIAWGYFHDESGEKHKAVIPDMHGNIKHTTVQDAKSAIASCKASFIKLREERENETTKRNYHNRRDGTFKPAGQ